MKNIIQELFKGINGSFLWDSFRQFSRDCFKNSFWVFSNHSSRMLLSGGIFEGILEGISESIRPELHKKNLRNFRRIPVDKIPENHSWMHFCISEEIPRIFYKEFQKELTKNSLEKYCGITIKVYWVLFRKCILKWNSLKIFWKYFYINQRSFFLGSCCSNIWRNVFISCSKDPWKILFRNF